MALFSFVISMISASTWCSPQETIRHKYCGHCGYDNVTHRLTDKRQCDQHYRGPDQGNQSPLFHRFFFLWFLLVEVYLYSSATSVPTSNLRLN